MGDIAVGAVGAAVIAALISIISLILGKEQKISEFRQAWIDELRKCIVNYLSCVTAIYSYSKINKNINEDTIINLFKNLNDASNGIKLRLNYDEKCASDLLVLMKECESKFDDIKSLSNCSVNDFESNFINASQKLLKFEWKRVKRGENAFYYTKIILYSVVFLLLILIICKILPDIFYEKISELFIHFVC